MPLKQKVFNACLNIIRQKAEALQSALNSITEAANNETKSTAGDKYETARAMMQLEQEKLNKQLKETLDQKSELEKININLSPSSVTKGSLVLTDKGDLFLSIGLGKIKVDEEPIIAISPLSPLGKKLMSLKRNDSAEVNGITYTIKEIL